LGDSETRQPTGSAEALRIVVGDDLAGHRADEAVLRSFSGFSRKEVKELFEAGRVRGSGRRLKKGDRVEIGTELVVEAPHVAIAPDASIPLLVLFESADFVIVDKPAGLPTAPLVRTETRSLAAALLARYPEMLGVGFREREPGLVHRLDNETSGVVLAARSQTAFLAARSLFDSSLIEKRYLAVVGPGLPETGEVETLLGPDPAEPRRVRVYDEAPSGYAKVAHTRYRVLTRGPRFSLVELSVERAFRHQIRVHLAHLGHPIAGDALYGGAPVEALGARHALHGSYIAWAGDAVRRGFRAEAALPAELRALVGGAGGA
jgi:23S rRNA pseudouridine1911/1915/1917 synthase